MKLQFNDAALDLMIKNIDKQKIDLELMWIGELVLQCIENTNDKEILEHKEELLNQLNEYIEDIRDILDDHRE